MNSDVNMGYNTVDGPGDKLEKRVAEDKMMASTDLEAQVFACRAQLEALLLSPESIYTHNSIHKLRFPFHIVHTGYI